MTAIKKLTDVNGSQYFPQTHTKAVIDDNGNSVEGVLGMQTQLINQAQLEVGAVPSDTAPTENSSNWVTSGGVFNAINTINQKFIHRVVCYSLDTSLPSKQTYTITSSLDLENGETYIFNIQTKDSSSLSAAVGFYLKKDSSSTGIDLIEIAAGKTGETFNFTPTDDYHILLAWSNVTTEQEFLITIEKDINVNKVYALYDTLGDSSIGSISQGKITDMLTNNDELFDHATATTSIRRKLSGDASDYIQIEHIEDGFRVSCLQTTTRTYASIRLPNLVVGETYYLSFDYNSSNIPSNKSPYMAVISNDTFDGTWSWGSAIARNTQGNVSVSFEAATTIVWLSVADNDLGAVGAWLDLTNISIVKKTVYEDVAGTLRALEKATLKIDEVSGDEAFNLANQTTDQTDASVLSVQKTNIGYRFDCISKTSNNYAMASIGDMVEGNTYLLTFDYESYIPQSWAEYTGMFTLTKNNSLSNPDIFIYLFLNQDKGRVVKTFTAPASKLYFRIAAANLQAGAYVNISNISLRPYGGAHILDEDGKIEKEAYSCVMTKFYSGTPIPSVTKQNVLGLDRVMSSNAFPSGNTVQACAAFGKYLFEFSNQGIVNIYDLETKTFVQQVTPTDDTGITETTYIHYNNVNFSKKYYDSGDVFPLLYASGESRINTDKAYVYRITENEGVFSMSIVQKISFQFTYEGSVTIGWIQVYIDTVFNEMVCNLPYDGVDNWYKFAIPEVVNNGTSIPSVVLSDSDVLDNFSTSKEDPVQISHTQGGIIVNGLCYNVHGVPSWGDEATLTVVDIWNKKHVCSVDLTALGWYKEPESLALYDDHLYMNTGGSIKGEGIWKLCF